MNDGCVGGSERSPLCRECDDVAQYKVPIHPSGAAYQVYCEDHLPDGGSLETTGSEQEADQ